MDGKQDENRSRPRRNSLSVVGPYARIRVIVAVIVFLIVIMILAVRALSG